MNYRIPLLLDPQPEGGYTVTSPLVPELVTEGDTVEEALENVKEAIQAVAEVYQDLGRPFPKNAEETPNVAAKVHASWLTPPRCGEAQSRPTAPFARRESG